jgi:hypothetical protein
VVDGRRPWAASRLTGAAPVGYGQGVIEPLELDDGEKPLAWLHGRYRSVGDLSGHSDGAEILGRTA